MVPIANSVVYLRPLYASPTTNPQPQLQYVVGVLGKNVQIDSSLSAVLSDLLNTTVSLPSESGGVSSTGTVPTAVAGILQQAQTDYTNALAALKAGNLAGFQADVNQMQAAIAQAQQVIEATTPGATTTTTTTAPAAKGGKSSKTTTTTTHASTRATTTTSSVPASTEPKNTTSTTSTTLVSAAPKT
jgi:hypothetical protein